MPTEQSQQRLHLGFAAQIASVQRIAGICVVETPKPMLHVDRMTRMGRHPCGVFRRNDAVEAIELELRESLVAPDEAPEVGFWRWQLDEVGLMRGCVVDVTQQAPVKLLCASDHEGNRAWRNDPDLHA